MGKEKSFGLIFILLVTMVIAACSGETSTNEESAGLEIREKDVVAEDMDDEPDALRETYEVPIQGEHAEIFNQLEMPMNEEDWYPADYTEQENSATAAFVPNEETIEDYTELVTIQYYDGENQLSSIENFILSMEEAMADMISGDLEFKSMDRTDEAGFYQFRIANDETQADQEEIGMVFQKDEALYLVRYTVMEQEISKEDEEVWLENMQQVQQNIE